jgi:thiamine-phosphate pyrophosphorylase
MKKYISKFHYLTQDLDHISHLEQTQLACGAGANWIQYRCLSKTDEEMLAELHPIAEVCDDWGATLIVTNHYHLVHQADIQGVHIEDMDADLNLIRAEIGENKTLGASATEANQVINHIKNSADYVGCGPFSITLTKPNNDELWGVKGYQNAVNQLKELGLETPIIAVGGVKLADVDLLLATGVHGLAVCSAINDTNNITKAYKEFHKVIF